MSSDLMAKSAFSRLANYADDTTLLIPSKWFQHRSWGGIC